MFANQSSSRVSVKGHKVNLFGCVGPVVSGTMPPLDLSEQLAQEQVNESVWMGSSSTLFTWPSGYIVCCLL